jgi:hypothetical protein
MRQSLSVLATKRTDALDTGAALLAVRQDADEYGCRFDGLSAFVGHGERPVRLNNLHLVLVNIDQREEVAPPSLVREFGRERTGSYQVSVAVTGGALGWCSC